MSDKLCNGDWQRRLKVEIFDYNDSGEHDFIGEYFTNLEEMAEGEGFQIVTWDVINAKKKARKGEDYENSGTVILKSINIDRVSVNFQRLMDISWYLTALSKMAFLLKITFEKMFLDICRNRN